ncbi:hypothetical protein H5410_031186, partial [Solanum commersonii]
MSPNCGLINTPNLNFCLSSSKTQVRQFKNDVSNSTTQDSIMNVHTGFNLLMQGSIVYSKTQVVTHHYQRFSSSQHLLQMQVQAQLRYSNALTQRMISYSHTMVCPYFPIDNCFNSLNIKKVFSRLVMGLSAK